MNNLVTMDVNGELKTHSKIVADVFGKPHRNIIRDIESLDCSEEFSKLNYEQSEYKTDRGKVYKCYNITEDGFYFLCMGFTGKKAAKWKESFLKTFKEMKSALSNVDSRIAKLTLDAEKIKEAGSEWSRMGHEINKAKKGHLLEVKKVMEDVQLKLDW